ncbi:MAG: hypothetical protein ACRDK9_09560 [Solirubrobacterales bacterium]
MERVLHTYHEPSPELTGYYDSDRLIETWERAWADAGWRTRILTLAEAREHPRWPGYDADIHRLPTINPRSYEDTNYHRWMAMAVVGGGFMSDTDVLLLGHWEPRADPGLTVYSIDYLEGDGACPCFVHGAAADYEAACDYFAGAAEWAGGWRHVSDQELLRAGRLLYDLRPEVLTYGDPRLAAEGRAVHLKNDAIRSERGTKSERVARLYSELTRPRPWWRALVRRADAASRTQRPATSRTTSQARPLIPRTLRARRELG